MQALAGVSQTMKALQLLLTTLTFAALTACGNQTVPSAVSPMNLRARSAQPTQMAAQASQRVVFHVVPDSRLGIWHVKQQNNANPVSTFRTKEQAIEAGRAIAKSHALSQLVVHKANGQIETEYTYGQDPANSNG